MKIRTTKGYLALMALLLIYACGTTTSITGSYKDPSFQAQGYKKVFIAALTSDVPSRDKIENSLSQSLTARGIQNVKSMDLFSPEFTRNDGQKHDLALEKIRAAGCDAIVTTALVRKESETRYVPGTAYATGPYAYYGRFGSYYSAYWGGVMVDPGYVTTDKTYYMETNVYDAQTEKLVWSAQSQTLNPSSLDGSLEDYKKALAKQLVKDGIFPAPTK